MIDDPEGPHPGHHKSGIKWLDLALALAVIALSVASLWTAQHTGKTMEKLVAENSRLVRANSTPILQFVTGNVAPPSTREISFIVSNFGTGTARVIWFEVAKDGVPMRGINQLIDYVPKPAEQDYITTASVAGSYMPAGENRAILTRARSTVPASAKAWDAMDGTRGELTTTACFCSVLGECWTSHRRADVPVPVKTCDARGHVSFGGAGVK